MRNYLQNPIEISDGYYVMTTENWNINKNVFHESKMCISVFKDDEELQKFYFRITPKRDEKSNKIISQVQNANVVLRRCM